MLNRHKIRRIVVVSIVTLVIIISFLYYNNAKPTTQKYERPSPTKTVEQYFAAWNSKDYPNMYAVISDGFKRIEPTAKDLASFKTYTESQNIVNIKIISLEEASNDGQTASVAYSVEFQVANGDRKPFEGTFTLKYRDGDIIPGWKLIHPYGNKIDTS